ncbi:MAG: GNAT family N-acetyltransferase [candidate division WOR-3 bacterium]|nr:GNAT family N-acetyltransferase [candidate division WOR-3 bacterium]
MSTHIKEFSPNDSPKWDEFVRTSWNGTIFHTRRFLSYHPLTKFNDKSLVVQENKKWLAVFPAAYKSGVITSHPGASYGGFVLQGPLSIKKTHDIVDSLINYLKEIKIKKVEMTLPPMIYQTIPCNYLSFVLQRENFTYKKRELSAYIPTSKKPFTLYKQEARTATRKAKREGVTVREGGSFKDFYEILKNNLAMRHNTTPTHTLDELLGLKELFPKRIRLFSAFYKNQQIAGTVLFEANKKVVLAFYISHNQKYQHLRPVNLLFYEVLKWAYRNHYKFLDLGTFTLNMEPNFGLGRFKESLGAQGIFRDYLELTL